VTITPVRSGPGNGGGYQICNLADISLAKFGQVFSQVRQASVYGDQTQVNDFFGITVNARFASGARISGGLDLGRRALRHGEVGRPARHRHLRRPPADRAVRPVPARRNRFDLPQTRVSVRAHYRQTGLAAFLPNDS